MRNKDWNDPRWVPDGQVGSRFLFVCVSIEGGVVKSISPFKLKIKPVERG